MSSSDRARQLRAAATPAERLLWSRIKGRQLGGWKFRRQQRLGAYIADFYCHEAALIVELDGGQHAAQALADTLRTARLERRNLRVLRFWNNEVLENLEGVLTRILEVAIKAEGPVAPIKPRALTRRCAPPSP
jgi:very-short-patch-repair endonuclease